MSNILITGSTGNLGATIVRDLLNAGCKLHLPVRKMVTENNVDIDYYETDLTNQAETTTLVETILKKAQRIDAGVFLAGGFMAGVLSETTMDDINNMVMLNVATAFNTTKSLLGHYKNSGGGKLIFIGAKAAMEHDTAITNFAYSLSKQMLYNFVMMISESERVNGITAHILLPKVLDTELNRKLMPQADFSKWTSTTAIASVIEKIILGSETKTVIEF